MKNNLITYDEVAKILGYKNLFSVRNAVNKGTLKLTKFINKDKKGVGSFVFFDKDEVLKLKQERENYLVKPSRG
jgi:hypothetical protein